MNKQQRITDLAILALAGIGLLLVAAVASPPLQVAACRGNAMVDCLLYINLQGKPIPNSFAGDFTVKGELMAGEAMVDGEITAGQLMVNGEITAGELMVRGEITTMDLMVQDTLMVGSGTVTIMEDSIDWGPGAHDDLTAADVTNLTDGGETNLHTHAEGAHNHDAAYLNDDQQEFMSANPGSFASVLSIKNTGTGPGIHGLSVSAEDVAVYAFTPKNGYSVWAQTSGPLSRAVYATSFGGTGVLADGSIYGVWAKAGQRGVYATGGEYGVYAIATGSGQYVYGVRGESTNGYGVYGYSKNGFGLYAQSINGPGIWGSSFNDIAVHGDSSHDTGVYGESFDGIGVNAESYSGTPLYVTGYAGTNLVEAWDTAPSTDNLRFKVERASGNVRADGTFSSPASDFAEMIAADSGGYEPGDVLVISPLNPRQVALATAPYATNLIGVYSTKPGFLGGYSEEEDQSAMVPVAITGIVPVKVSTENGAIQPGDLLTTSSTPGHAMLAIPVTVEGVSFYLPGTILGKALEPLDSGSGVILVLVTLQ